MSDERPPLEKENSADDTSSTLAATAGASEGKWWKNPLVWFAATSAAAAVTSAYAAYTNVQVTRLQYRPQVAMRSQATFRYELGKPLLVAVSIKNVGSMTIYDATLEYATNIVPAGQESRIFALFKDPQTGVVIAPTEEQLAWVHTRPLTPIDYQRITSGQGHLMVGAHLSFTDDLGRHHDRYLCTSYIPDGLALTGTTCATPAQS